MCLNEEIIPRLSLFFFYIESHAISVYLVGIMVDIEPDLPSDKLLNKFSLKEFTKNKKQKKNIPIKKRF